MRQVPPTSAEYLKWVHFEFCKRLRLSCWLYGTPTTGRTVELQLSELRDGEVVLAGICRRRLKTCRNSCSESKRLTTLAGCCRRAA